MPLVLQLLRYNDFLAPTISLAGNFMLIYLIITVNKIATKQISFVLIPSCINDMLLALATYAQMLQVFNIGLNAYVVCGSPLNVFGNTFASISLWFYASCLLTAMNGSCITFYIRYRYVCHNQTMPKKLFLFLYLLLSLSGVMFFFLFRWTFPIIDKNDPRYQKDLLTDFWLEEYPDGPKFTAAQVNDISFILPYTILFTFAGINYGLVIFFGIKITRTLRKHANSFSKSHLNAELNRQLHINLIVQAIVPFLVLCLPLIILVIMMFMKYENLNLSLFLSFFYGWMPVVNPLSAIFIISPYRKRIQSILGIKQKIMARVKITMAISQTAMSRISIKF